jgi:hypothetical protein
VHNTLVVVLEDSYGFSHKVEGWDGVIDVLDESCYLIGVSQGSLPITLLDVSCGSQMRGMKSEDTRPGFHKIDELEKDDKVLDVTSTAESFG